MSTANPNPFQLPRFEPCPFVPPSQLAVALGSASVAAPLAGPVSGRVFEPYGAVPLDTGLLPVSSSLLTAQQLIEAQSTTSRVVKRTGDILFSLAVLGLGSPLFLLLAALVKLSSPGPVFYVQRRIGRGYKGFGCIKFRTMRRDADRILATLLEQSPELKAEFKKDFKLKADPRITPIGKFLRRSSLDELPQFINVLRGQMSVVGPRPIVWQELDRYGRQMDEVLAVRPGLTGLWQVSGRNNLSYETRVGMDVRYARRRGFLLDMAIILRTIGVMLFPRDRGAY